MPAIFITGATGNVGRAVIEELSSASSSGIEIIAGVRDPAAWRAHPHVRATHFDFADATTFPRAIASGQIVFLLRPPQLASTKPFDAFLSHAKSVGVAFIVFLSVQGVERSSIIPHNRIEKLVVASGLPYCFL